MKVILKGARWAKKKVDMSALVTRLFFVIFPILLFAAAVVLLFIQLGRLNDNIFVKLFELVGEVGRARTGWFFADGATFMSVYKDNAIEYTLRFLALALVWFFGRLILSYHCPECGHYFTMHRISAGKYVGATSRRVSQSTQEYRDAWTVGERGNLYYSWTTVPGRQWGTEETDHYSYNLKCSCCGCVVQTEKSKSRTHWG